MKIYEFPFPIEIGQVVDLDFSMRGEPISIQGSRNHQVLMWGDRRLELPADWTCPEFPFVRALSDDRAIIVDSGFKAGTGENAWIIDSDGHVQTRFALGSAAVEVVPLKGLIAVAFHPLSARSHGYLVQPAQRTGIAFYDYSGKLVMGLNQELAHVGCSVENVRCMAPVSRSELLFAPERVTVAGQEVENPIVLFDCAAPRRPRIFSAPYPRPEAVTWDPEGLIHLASPEGWEDQIITFDPRRKISQHRGEFLGIFRGLEAGGFLAQLSTAEYVLVRPEAPQNTGLHLSQPEV